MSERVIVTTDELARAIAVWMTVMPERVWKQVEEQMVLKMLKRQDTCFDARPLVAEHIAAKLREAGWTVTRTAVKHPSGSSGR